jgi:hypothetical protein
MQVMSPLAGGSKGSKNRKSNFEVFSMPTKNEFSF